MNKQEFLNELKAHDWYYTYASGPAYYKGAENSSRLLALAESGPDLKALYKAYSAFIFNGGEEPTIEADSSTKASACTPNKQRYNTQLIMLDAWKIARTAARRFGGKAKAYFAMALRQAWAKAKALALSSHATTTPSQVYFLCIDIKTGRNTRLINQPAVDTVYTNREEALAALNILNGAFHHPFIKTSAYYNMAG